ncbi:dTDP-4-dehydrorhamnose reductase [Bradyrhizobium sp. HKCCYLS20291]|uniref:dTDP-4-dehydrorhamnose reductase n=1 Tax=Bradyrhizobium sp. HKCCYLS20291 TaxID=3420766 RepID=UPI003EBE7E5E
MRILLTGASGQVGGALLPLLRRRGHEVIAPDSAALDLARPEGLAAVLDGVAPDLIINPAAYTAVDQAEDAPDTAFAVNAAAPAALARWAAGRAVPLVQFSTDYVFDGSGTTPWREDDPCRPLSVYGSSKRDGEVAIQAAGGPHLIIRTSWVYAAQGRNFLRTIIRLARERDELRIVSDQTGAPTSAATLAAVLTAIIEGGAGDLAAAFAAASGIVHVANAGTTSWHGFAEAIVAGMRARGVRLAVREIRAVSTAEYGARAIRPLNSRLDLARLRQVFGITPPDWREALAAELDRALREGAD